ncbi:hypothetical protein [Spongiactinospora sp. TRM90649]|uniref:hypothetical protein n=1 Tax=Spongiactinospora sp. TRM90649 TaxID=3031114 RepID=UPI0023F631FD|nr:hypothetical protein [Spongiactinospora sp. TRM90649]MDF5756627.1 hypothetical protein [Spongiactinospora sp. TRM90649]
MDVNTEALRTINRPDPQHGRVSWMGLLSVTAGFIAIFQFIASDAVSAPVFRSGAEAVVAALQSIRSEVFERGMDKGVLFPLHGPEML